MEDRALQSTKAILPWVVAVAFFMEALDTTVLNTAVPVMSEALGVLPLSMKSVLSSYTLSLAVFIPVSSWVADRYGTRRVFASAIALFTIGSLLCGVSTSIHWLVLSRILQGGGGAMMVPVGRLTLVRTFPRSELIGAMSFVAIPALIGPMLGPLAGGLIVHYLHWRMIFFVNLPIGILGLFLVLRFLPDYRAHSRRALDLVGMILFSSGVALLSYVLEVFGDHSLGVIEILSLLLLSLSLLVGYWEHAKKMAHPLLRLDLFRIRTFRISIVGNLATRLAAGGLPFLLPLLYQLGLGYSPVKSGLLTVPQSLMAMLLKLTMPKIISRFGYRKVLISNTIAMGGAIMLFGSIGPATPIWVILIIAGLFGFFTSLQFTSMNTLIYSDVAEKDTSMAATILSTAQQMALSFGVAMASICTAFLLPATPTATGDALIRGLHRSFVLLGSLTILSAVGFLELKPEDGENMKQTRAVAAEV